MFFRDIIGTQRYEMHLPLKDYNLRIIHVPRSFFFAYFSYLHSFTFALNPVPDSNKWDNYMHSWPWLP